MRLFARATLAAVLLAACHTAAPAGAPSPTEAPTSVSIVAASASATTQRSVTTPNDAQRRTSARSSQHGQTQRGHGTRTVLVVAGVAALAVAVLVVARSSASSLC